MFCGKSCCAAYLKEKIRKRTPEYWKEYHKNYYENVERKKHGIKPFVPAKKVVKECFFCAKEIFKTEHAANKSKKHFCNLNCMRLWGKTISDDFKKKRHEFFNRRYRSQKNYGEFWEAHLKLREFEKNINKNWRTNGIKQKRIDGRRYEKRALGKYA